MLLESVVSVRKIEIWDYGGSMVKQVYCKKISFLLLLIFLKFICVFLRERKGACGHMSEGGAEREEEKIPSSSEPNEGLEPTKLEIMT